MQLPRFEYIRPRNLSEGLAALSEHRGDVKIMSGGTDLLINMKFRLDTPRVLISFNGLEELQVIEEEEGGGLRLGGGCRLTDLVNHPLIGRYPALRDALYSVASRHVRNVGTLGGNLCLDTRCWYTNQSENWRATRDGCYKTDTDYCHVIKTSKRCVAISSTDAGPMLIALGASVVLSSHGSERELPLQEFYQDDGVEHTVLQPGEILTAVRVPPPAGRAVFAKLAQREGLDFASGAFAAACTGPNDKPESMTLVLGSVAPEPKLLNESARILMEGGLTDECIEQAALAARGALGEVTNLFTPSGYKRRLIKALIREALYDLRDQDET